MASRKPAKKADLLLLVIIAAYAGTYLALFISNQQFFVFKTMLVPAFLIYALGSRNARAFATDWLPFLSATVLFDIVRGFIFVDLVNRDRPILIDYVIGLERLFFGSPAVPQLLQRTLRSAPLDVAMVALHGAHFVVFLLCGLTIWHARRPEFRRFAWSVILTFYIGALCYFLWPTAPPWYASEHGSLPVSVDRIMVTIYRRWIPELYGAFDTNPVAAMPSLHAALPIVCALSLLRAFGWRVAAGFGVYVVGVAFAIVYLGEHYLVDVAAGILLAWAATVLGRRFENVWIGSLPRALAAAVALTLMAFALATYR